MIPSELSSVTGADPPGTTPPYVPGRRAPLAGAAAADVGGGEGAMSDSSEPAIEAGARTKRP